MRKHSFCLYDSENEVADQMYLWPRYRGKTSVSDPEDGFFATRLIYNYEYKQLLQEGLSACSQCVGMDKLGWVKAIHRLKCNHAGCFYF